ncbi:MAG: toprim domain-containing protein [Candidatus Woesearchaeota archaeon]
MKNTDFHKLKQKAKEKSIIDYLATKGFEPKSKTGNGSQVWFISPLRQKEKKPSFKVNIEKNAWCDYGISASTKGQHKSNFLVGDIIDLVMRLENISFTAALHQLNNSNVVNSFSFGGKQTSESSDIRINKIRNLKNTALIDYLNKRGITFDIANKYLKEAYYYVGSKHYFALAFGNDKKGFELRNKYFKGSISPKFYTTINPGDKSLNLFEGFIDFLSFLELYKIIRPDYTSIILNSTTTLEYLLPKIKYYSSINMYLDNDQGGQEATKRIKNANPKAKDCASRIYPNNKDLNDYLMKIKKINN